MRVFLQQFVRHHHSREAVDVVAQAAHRFTEDPPERRRTLAVRYAEVDGIRERPAPVDPVVRRHGVVATFFSRQRFHPDGVSVRVHATVLDHEIDADQIALKCRPPRRNVTLVHLLHPHLCLVYKTAGCELSTLGAVFRK